MNLDELIAYLVEARKERGLTQTQLAELMGTTHSHISRLENRVVDPAPSTLEKWADALAVTAFYGVRKEDIERNAA